MQKRYNLFAVIIFIFVTLVSFRQFFFEGKVPISGDVILGTNYPWLDQRWGGMQTIFPVLNPTVSDSVTSFYPWKYKAVSEIKAGNFPFLDNSTYMGNPLFATGTTGVLYPLNIIFLLTPFNFGWGILASLTPFLSALFFYIWLRSKDIHPVAATIAGISYGFSAFIGLQVTFINSPHAVLWLPLVLLCIDKLLTFPRWGYFLLMVFVIFSSLMAGFFQGSLYLLLVSFLYFLYNLILLKPGIKKVVVISLGFLLPVLLSFVQIVPFVETVGQSSRVAGYGGSPAESEIFQFFVQFRYLITTFVPDFFGNPGKWNYWGEPNYYEFNNFVGSISIIGLLAFFFSWKHLKSLTFFFIMLVFSIIMATPNFISQYPYYHSWPIISSLVPARILMITQFSLLTLSAFGLNEIFRRKLPLRFVVTSVVGLVAVDLILLFTAFLGRLEILSFLSVLQSHWEIAFRNTILPLLVVSVSGLLMALFYKTKRQVFLLFLVFLTALELIRQTGYFRPFIDPELLYPKTPAISYLQENSKGFRYMVTHPDLLPSNLQTIYGLESVDGAGPLFPENYNRMMGGINFSNSKENLPHFKRTINFSNYASPALGILNIKYILSLEEINNPVLNLVFEEGKTRVYENTKVLPRAFIAEKIKVVSSPNEVIKTLKSRDFVAGSEVVISDPSLSGTIFSPGKKEVLDIKDTEHEVSLSAVGDGVLVLSKQFYPGWKGFIDEKEVSIFPVNSDLIGLILPGGEHKVRLIYQPESFKIGLQVSLASLAVLIIVVLYLKFSERKKS